MREADMIDVAPFHQHHLLEHLLASNGVTRRRIGFMTVHTLEFHGFIVHVEVSSCQLELVFLRFCLANLDGPNAEVGRSAIEQSSFLVFEFGYENISVGPFCTPKHGIFYFKSRHERMRLTFLQRFGSDRKLLAQLFCLVRIEFDREDAIGYPQAFLLFPTKVAEFSVNLNGRLFPA